MTNWTEYEINWNSYNESDEQEVQLNALEQKSIN